MHQWHCGVSRNPTLWVSCGIAVHSDNASRTVTVTALGFLEMRNVTPAAPCSLSPLTLLRRFGSEPQPLALAFHGNEI